jgi:hypothetical protein
MIMVSSRLINNLSPTALILNTPTQKRGLGDRIGTIMIPRLITIGHPINPFSPSSREAIGQYSSISAIFIWG